MQPSIPFYHVRNPSVYVPLETVLKTNNTTDGYYIPQQIPILPDSLIYKNPPPSFRDIAFEVFRSFFRDVIPESDLYTIIAHAFSFKVPVFPIDPRISLNLRTATAALTPISEHVLLRSLSLISIAATIFLFIFFLPVMNLKRFRSQEHFLSLKIFMPLFYIRKMIFRT